MNDDDASDGTCPACGSRDIEVYYSAPLQYKCSKCGAQLRDLHEGPAISVITTAEAHAKRPAMYGLPHCRSCLHTPHDGDCKTECGRCLFEVAERERERTYVPTLVLA